MNVDEHVEQVLVDSSPVKLPDSSAFTSPVNLETRSNPQPNLLTMPLLTPDEAMAMLVIRQQIIGMLSLLAVHKV